MPVACLRRPSRSALPVAALALLALAPPLPAWNSFIGGAHRPIAKVALSWFEPSEFPDLTTRRGDVVDGANSEAGHPNMAHDGGRPDELWYGTEAATKGGVLGNYCRFDLRHAYKNLGLICHLTQDQAVPAHAANIYHNPLKADMLEFFVPGNSVTGSPPQQEPSDGEGGEPGYDGIIGRGDDLPPEPTEDLETTPDDVGFHRGATMADLLDVLAAARPDGTASAIALDDDLPPFAPYQAVQDDTRSRLPGLVHPGTGHPYWRAPADAPPLGQDATYGPRGRYGPDGNCYAIREQPSDGAPFPPASDQMTTWVTLSPEIWKRQVSVAAAATHAVLRSASRLLPPLVKDLSVPAGSVATGDGVPVTFSVLENRTPAVRWAVLVLRDGALVGVLAQGEATCILGAGEGGLLGAQVQTTVVIDGATMPSGSYVLDVRLTDADGNTTPDLVNEDDIPQNDTLAPLTVR